LEYPLTTLINKRHTVYIISIVILLTICMDNQQTNFFSFVANKLSYLQTIIKNTIISIQKHNTSKIFSDNDTEIAISVLQKLFISCENINTTIETSTQSNEEIINTIQTIIDKLSMIICGFGTKYIDDLLFIVFGSEWTNIEYKDEILNEKHTLIKQHIHPTGYKIIHWKPKHVYNKIKNYCCNKISDEQLIIEESSNLECFDMEIDTENVLTKIQGIRCVFQNEKNKKTLVVYGLLDYIPHNIINNKYVSLRVNEIQQLCTSKNKPQNAIIHELLNNAMIKDILIHSKNDFYKRMFGVINEVNNVKQCKLDATIKRFMDADVFTKRNILMNLFTYSQDNEIQYISYLLYELLQLEENSEQVIYFQFPWKIKNMVKDIGKLSAKNNNDMLKKYETTQISLEQQIYVMKTNDQIKEKAILKLKEIKGKPDEMTLKTRQYLEGLLKIPFGIYREEPLLKRMTAINSRFNEMKTTIGEYLPITTIPPKKKFTCTEIISYNKQLITSIDNVLINITPNEINNHTTKYLNNCIRFIQSYCKENKQTKQNITLSNIKKTKKNLIQTIVNFLKQSNIGNNKYKIYDYILPSVKNKIHSTITNINGINQDINNVNTEMESIKQVMDKSIHGHSHAKNQIMKIIGQWINGEQSGYCFGFEGSPGIGKTSLAKKGIAECLINENNEKRPFAFISVGGSCNGSTLEGHSYTYHNSTWGRIVDILMDSKCMNPIIYVDELDKISKTEQGKEIIGIFTHLIDSTQNDSFQDKYFSGIDIDLSKALFIFSYNDPEQIDRILLDRIHRITFENLTLDEKLVIVNKYILPEINDKMGFEDIVVLNDEVTSYIIDKYTCEPGVRKLKEVLFDLYGEINLQILHNNEDIQIPIHLTNEIIDNYLKHYTKVVPKVIHENHEIGVINGLWANSLGQGGIIPIQTMYFPTNTFLDLLLTGLQGNVMKESMNVAKTLAWDLTPNDRKQTLIKKFQTTKSPGLHIHCPEGAISKDGPSAGAAITLAIFSLFNSKQIRNDVAITGEINLQGQITTIGGLGLKINGGIKAGIKKFLYPYSNHDDFNKWRESNETITDIQFICVKHIQETFNHIFV